MRETARIFRTVNGTGAVKRSERGYSPYSEIRRTKGRASYTDGRRIKRYRNDKRNLKHRFCKVFEIRERKNGTAGKEIFEIL